MYEEIKTCLKRFQDIEPDGGFVAYARGRVLGSGGPRMVSPFFMATGGIAVAALVTVLTVMVLNPVPPAVLALETDSLQSEFQGLKLDLQLRKLDYTQEVHDTITTALAEISGKTNHLNKQLIEMESENGLVGTLEATSSPAEQINALLDEVLE